MSLYDRLMESEDRTRALERAFKRDWSVETFLALAAAYQRVSNIGYSKLEKLIGRSNLDPRVPKMLSAVVPGHPVASGSGMPMDDWELIDFIQQPRTSYHMMIEPESDRRGGPPFLTLYISSFGRGLPGVTQKQGAKNGRDLANLLNSSEYKLSGKWRSNFNPYDPSDIAVIHPLDEKAAAFLLSSR